MNVVKLGRVLLALACLGSALGPFARRGRAQTPAGGPSFVDLSAQSAAALPEVGERAAEFARLVADFQAGLLSEATNVIDPARTSVEPPVDRDLDALPEPGTEEHRRLTALGEVALREGRVGVVVLNGGMATRFGGGVKGVKEAFDGRSFLQVKAADVASASRAYGRAIPLYLMNSFATEGETAGHLSALEQAGLEPGQAKTFRQPGKFPRLNPDGTTFTDATGQPSWYAPGHGGLRAGLAGSGLLAEFRARGGEVLLVSNVDNLAATVDPAVVGYHLRRGRDVTVEVAQKAPGDKGGAPAVVGGKLQLVEGFRFPKTFDQDRIAVFNTANLVLSAAALERPVALPWYVVSKKVDGKPVVQFEQLVGDLTAELSTSYLRVSREGPACRFLPIKEPEDLVKSRDRLRSLLATRTSGHAAAAHSLALGADLPPVAGAGEAADSLPFDKARAALDEQAERAFREGGLGAVASSRSRTAGYEGAALRRPAVR